MLSVLMLSILIILDIHYTPSIIFLIIFEKKIHLYGILHIHINTIPKVKPFLFHDLFIQREASKIC